MIQEQLKQGSFRQIAFNFSELSRSSGRKSVFHTFPNSDIVLPEDLGRLPRKFSLSIIVHGVAEEYFSKRDALQEALDAEGPGELVHPTYGTIDVQIEGPYSSSEKLGSLGVFTASVTFIAVNKGEFLPEDNTSPIAVTNQTEAINEAVGELLDETLITTSQGAWDVVRENVDKIQAFAEDALKFVTDSEAFNELTVAIQNIDTFYNDILSSLGPELTDLFDLIEESIDDPRELFNQFAKLFDYNDAEVENLPISTTRELKEIADNIVVFRDFVQIEALTHAVNASTDIEYTTEDDLQGIADQVYDQFDKVTEPETTSEIYNDLQAQKVGFNDFVSEEEQSVLRVITVNTTNDSLTTLVYKYYGNLDNFDLIQNLNGFNEPSKINGDVQIVTNV